MSQSLNPELVRPLPLAPLLLPWPPLPPSPPSVVYHAPVGLPLAVSAAAPSSSADPLCRDCWPSCRRRARTCSWTLAARSLSASGPSAPRRSSCRSEGSAKEQTPASGCRADSRKLPSCIVTGATGQPTCPGPLPGLVPQGPVPEVSSWLALLETDTRPARSLAGGGDTWARWEGGASACLRWNLGGKTGPACPQVMARPSFFPIPGQGHRD